uniref:Uncharacterized protein n=1 Tax=virus sp. ctBM815 TaxID=2825806 RepID=A0A8S5RJS3_9VIRU|nr:MAG TPA: hypothetical protein [virus sp. ctBM815]
MLRKDMTARCKPSLGTICCTNMWQRERYRKT